MGRFQTGGRVVEVRRRLGSWSFSIDGRPSGKRYMSRARASGAGLLAVQRIARVVARRAAERKAAAPAPQLASG